MSLKTEVKPQLASLRAIATTVYAKYDKKLKTVRISKPIEVFIVRYCDDSVIYESFRA